MEQYKRHASRRTKKLNKIASVKRDRRYLKVMVNKTKTKTHKISGFFSCLASSRKKITPIALDLEDEERFSKVWPRSEIKHHCNKGVWRSWQCCRCHKMKQWGKDCTEMIYEKISKLAYAWKTNHWSKTQLNTGKSPVDSSYTIGFNWCCGFVQRDEGAQKCHSDSQRPSDIILPAFVFLYITN